MRSPPTMRSRVVTALRWWSTRSALIWFAAVPSTMSNPSAARLFASRIPMRLRAAVADRASRSDPSTPGSVLISRPLPDRSADPRAMAMKIASFNVNGIRSCLPRLLEWLGEAAPHVVCLQELKCDDDSFPVSEVADAGYGAVWHGQKGFNGVAILAKGADPAERRRGLPGDPDDTHSRYLAAEVAGILIR